jgi:hypothetical protein
MEMPDGALIAELEAQSESIPKGLPVLVRQMQERERLLKKDAKDNSEIRRRALRKMLDFSASKQREMEAAIRTVDQLAGVAEKLVTTRP